VLCGGRSIPHLDQAWFRRDLITATPEVAELRLEIAAFPYGAYYGLHLHEDPLLG
jgi:hypothetical protein